MGKDNGVAFEKPGLGQKKIHFNRATGDRTDLCHFCRQMTSRILVWRIDGDPQWSLLYCDDNCFSMIGKVAQLSSDGIISQISTNGSIIS